MYINACTFLREPDVERVGTRPAAAVQGPQSTVMMTLAQVWFNAIALSSMTLCMVVCWIIHHTPACFFGVGGSLRVRSKRESASAAACYYLFNIPVLLSPWIRESSVDAAAQQAEWERLDATLKTRPVFVLGNHTSFFDVLLFSVRCPTTVLGRTRTLAKRGLFTAPVFGYIARSIGHFPVHFSGSKSGDFSVDKTAMCDVMEKAEQHLDGRRCPSDGNGCLAFFPEGQINRIDTAKLQSFRRGMFSVALKKDVAIWAWIVDGNGRTWPPHTAGGLPATVTTTLVPIAPDGVQALVKERGIKADTTPLAELTHELMQIELTKLLASIGGGGNPKAE